MVTMKYGIMMGYVTILGAYITVSITGARQPSAFFLAKACA